MPTPAPVPVVQIGDTHYLSLRQAEAEGFAAYSTLRSWIAKGLPCVKHRGAVYVARDELEAWRNPAENRAVLDAAVERLVALAPRLTAEQRQRLAMAVIAG